MLLRRMPDWLSPETRRGMEAVTAQLVAQFAGTFSRETVEGLVGDTLARWPVMPSQHFLPVVIYRFARDRLRAMGQTEGAITKERPRVLFVSSRDGARSQMAAGLLSRAAEERVDVCSAGVTPALEVDPAIVAVLAEVGIDLRAAFPKPLTDEILHAADRVVTIGGADPHPALATARAADWDVPDLARRSLDELREIRDHLDRRASDLLDSLGL